MKSFSDCLKKHGLDKFERDLLTTRREALVEGKEAADGHQAALMAVNAYEAELLDRRDAIYKAIGVEAPARAEAAKPPTPEPAGEIGTIDNPLRFSSGMSRPGDFVKALAADHSIGIEIGELSEGSIPRIAKGLVETPTARIFVDTGAYSLFRAKLRSGKFDQFEGSEGLDFPAIFDKFERLQRAISQADEGESARAVERVFYVMPDIVGNQSASLELLAEHQDEIRDYVSFGQPIVPLQQGERTLSQAFDVAAKILGREDLVIGIPANQKAVTPETFKQFITERGDRIWGIHLLGAGAQSKIEPYLQVLRDAEFDGHVSVDANRLRSAMYGETSRAEALRKLLSGEIDQTQARRSLEADLFGALRNNVDLHNLHAASAEDFKTAVDALVEQYVAQKREAAAAPQKAAMDSLVAKPLDPKFYASLQKQAEREFRKTQKENAEQKTKLRNTGEDLRRHWELVKAERKKKNDATGVTTLNNILASTTRADLFADLLGEGATPGAARYVDLIRAGTKTFKDWLLGEKGMLSNTSGRWIEGRAFDEQLLAFVKGEIYPHGDRGAEIYAGIIEPVQGQNPYKDATLDQRLDALTNAAETYLEAVRSLTGLVKGKTNVQGIADAIKTLFTSDATAYSRWLTQKSMSVEGWRLANTAHILEDKFIRARPDQGYVTQLLKGETNVVENTRKQPLVPPRLENIKRESLPGVRDGDVTPKQTKKQFGFADIGFGTWVAKKEDQANLNLAWDAFSDLSRFLGIDPTHIGFKGRLHFVIGALGHGAKAAATFHPAHPGPNGTVQAINLTKTKGDGTVAHEWGHALDHYLRETDGGNLAMKDVVTMLKTVYRPEVLRDRAIAALKGETQLVSRRHKSRRLSLNSPDSVLIENAKDIINHYNRGSPSNYKQNADRMDPEYWGNDRELFARAWESWISDSLGGVNNYLVNPAWVGEGLVKPPMYKGIPYPMGDERVFFARMLTAFRSSLKQDGDEITVDEERWNALRPRPADEMRKAADDLKAELPELLQMLRYEKQANSPEGKKREAEAQAALEAERARQEAEAREKEQTDPVVPPAPEGELSDDDLENMFDDAAESARAEANEDTTAPEPGQPALEEKAPPTSTKQTSLESGAAWDAADVAMLTKQIEGGAKILFSGAGSQYGLPTIQSVPNARHIGMGVFEAAAPGWKIMFDAGGAMERTPSGIAYSVIQEKEGSYPYNRYAVLEDLKRAAPAPTAPKAGALIAEAAKLGVKGADEALKGLTKLFGAGKIQSFPGGLDEATYKEAKPHFEAALRAFQAAGKTLKDLFKLLFQQFGEGIKPYAIHFAKEMKLTANLGDAPSASKQVADWVHGELANGNAISWQELFAQSDKAFGGTQAEGKYTPKDAYDAEEAGMNLWIASDPLLRENALGSQAFRLSVGGVHVNTAKRTISELSRVLNLLPTQTKRTQEQDEFQQFSTVPPLAFAANWVANIQEGELMGETSAGIGGLAVFAKIEGARLFLNELSSRRAAVLREVLPDARIETEKGEQIANLFPDDRPTVVVINPPFSATAGRVPGQRDTMNGAAHVEAALKWLKPGGRLVAIVGNGMEEGRPAFVGWWNKIKSEYTVRANLSLSGAEYMKYGTGFDNNLVVIDKIGPQAGTKVVTGKVEAYSELPALLQEVRDARTLPTEADSAVEQPTPESGGGETTAPGVEQPKGPARPGPGTVGGAGEGAGDGGGRGAGPTPAGGEPTGGNAVGGGEPGGGRNTGRGRTGQPPTGGGGGVSVGEHPEQDGLPELDAGGAATRTRELTESIFEQYEPRKAILKGSQPHPGKLVESAAMASVDPIDVTYTPNLPQEIIASGAISSAQIEAAIYAGQAHQQHLPTGERRGYFDGDGTGVGKGRIISAVILDNMRQGRKKAMWISAASGLIKAARRDWKGIGGKDADIFGMRDVKDGGAGPSDKITRKNGIMFLTYDTLKGGEKPDMGSKGLAPGSTVVIGNPFGGNNATAKLVKIDKNAKKVTVDQNGKRTAVPFAQVLSIGGSSDWLNKFENAGAGQMTSLKQIVEWVGKDYDGVIAFDEAHKMQNLGGQKGARGKTKPAQRAVIAQQLRAELPQARVLFVSATGATEVANLSYLDRLGLWGEGTSFATSNDLVSKISAAGLASMELVARDMKAMGMYIARSLSYDGVEQERIDASFTPLQHDIYNELAQAWQIIIQNVQAALTETGAGNNGQAKGAAMSALWSTQQRFFNQVITSMMAPAVLDHAKRQLDAGHAAVFQLVNTNEAAQERAVERAEAEDTALEELDFTPKQSMIEYLRKAFPVAQYEEGTDGNGNTVWVPVIDSDGNPVLNQELVAKRDALIKHIEDNLRVPDNPLDLIYEAFGEKNVGEVSGRGRRFQKVMAKDGSFTLEERKRSGASNEADAEAFMDDRKKVLAFTDAGGTGFSYDSDRTVKNQRRRMHYLLQPGWIAANAVQGIGRTHRSNEANQPMVLLPQSNLKAQKRFISSIARRLDQLGALTRGQRDTASAGLFKASDNLESKYAVAALRQLIEDMAPQARGQTGGTIQNAASLIHAMGLNEIYNDDGVLIEGKMPPVQRFLNRMLSLTMEQQDEIFAEFENRLEAAVQAAIERGTFDDGMQTLHALKVVKTRDDTIYTDERTKAETRFVELELTKAAVLNDWNTVRLQLNLHPGKGSQFYIDNQTGQPFVVVDQGTRVGADGKLQYRGYRFNVRAPSAASRGHYIVNRNTIEQGGGTHVSRQEETLKPETVDLSHIAPGMSVEGPKTKVHERRGPRYEKLDHTDVIEYLWNSAVEEAPKTYTEPTAILTGILLPVWDRIQVGDTERTSAVVRTQTDEGERFIGRVVRPEDRVDILKNFGLGDVAPDMPVAKIIARIMGGEQARLSNSWIVRKVKVANENRLEIFTSYIAPSEAALLKQQGAFVERIQYRDRLFIPTGDHAVFERITRGSNHPVVEFFGGEGKLSLPKGWGVAEAQKGFGARTVEQVERFAQALSKQWKNAPPIVVVRSIADLPFKVPEKVRGAYWNGKVYLVADNLASNNAVQYTILHETLGHYGLHGLLGDQLVPMMNRIYATNAAIRIAADERMATYEKLGRKLDRATATEEALAHMAGRGEWSRVSGWQLLFAAIRAGLRKIGFNLGLSNDEIASLLANARRYVREGDASTSPDAHAPKLALGPIFTLAADGPLGTIKQELLDRFAFDGKHMSWINRTINTQYHKAQINEHYRKVYQGVQRYIADVNAMANDAADEAGERILPRMRDISDVWFNPFKFSNWQKERQLQRDLKTVGQVVWAATLADKRPTDYELFKGFKAVVRDTKGDVVGEVEAPPLEGDQLEHYHRIRAAIDLSLDQAGASEMVKIARDEAMERHLPSIEEARKNAKDDPRNAAAILTAALQERLETIEDRRADESMSPVLLDRYKESTEATLKAIEDKAALVIKLQDEGYAPLMRFGRYTAKVIERTRGVENVLYFGMFESMKDANKTGRDMLVELQLDHPEAVLVNNTMDTESWKQMRGLSLDTLQAFADVTGIDADMAVQEYLKMAIASRSAMKRLIHRKGIKGYDEDVQRVLATFVTSQARFAARNYHFGELVAATQAIPEGDTRAEASKLTGYVQNPGEEAQGLRGFLFTQFLGGSIASALTNITQPILMTLPYLSQYEPATGLAGIVKAPAAASIALAKALKVIAKGTTDPRLREALDVAAKEGHTEPQEIHQLYAESIRSGLGGRNLQARKALRLWSSMFSLSESFNRRITFIAAFELASQPGMMVAINAKRAEQGRDAFAGPYSFAVNAINDTQGVYNKGNRPNWARGGIGATVFTFKQFSIAYVEFLTRLPPREKAIALAILVMAAGAEGLPFEDDLVDLWDTIWQAMGFSSNAKKSIRKWATQTLGEAGGGFLTGGLSGLPGSPIDVSGRLGVGNLIPGTALFARSTQDATQEITQALGPIGSVLVSARQAFAAAEAGQLASATYNVVPKAIRDAMQAMDMAQTGYYRDLKGRRGIDVSGVDAAFKAIGLQPYDVAQEGKRRSDIQQDIALHNVVEAGIADRWARGIFEKDPAEVEKAIKELFAWNQKNPDLPIAITPAQIRERVQKALQPADVRQMKQTPREIRGQEFQR